MRLITLWGKRVGSEDDAPELMVAWDQYSLDGYPEGFDAECTKARKSWGDDLAESRLIEIEVPEARIRNAFEPPLIAGVVK